MGISDDIIKQIQNALNAGIKPQNLNEAAKELAQSVKKRTRLGKGVAKDGDNLKKLDELSPAYKVKRKGLKRRGKLAGETAPAKSNLTKSGKMLDSIEHRITKDGFEIFVSGSDQQEKVKWANAARPFLFISSFELKVLIKSIFDRITRAK